MITKDFEEYFPFPWNIFFYGDGVHYIETDSDRGFWIMEEKGDGSTKQPDSAEGRAAMKYIVRCANLMPEAVELLKDTNTKLKQLCEICGFENIGNECIRCTMPGFVTRVDALLAKLEGGANDEDD